MAMSLSGGDSKRLIKINSTFTCLHGFLKFPISRFNKYISISQLPMNIYRSTQFIRKPFVQNRTDLFVDGSKFLRLTSIV